MICCSARAVVCALGVTVALVACQPVDDLDEPVEAGPTAGEVDRRGAPDTAVGPTLAASLANADGEAARWQAGARITEAAVELDGDRLTSVRVTYVAPDADRLLTVTFTSEGMREERPTLGTLDLGPITGDALAALPPLPEGLQEPTALAATAPEAFAACDVGGEPDDVLYASGAPLAWNPETGAWAGPLAWTATVTGGDGGGAVLDPVSAEVLDCLESAG